MLKHSDQKIYKERDFHIKLSFYVGVFFTTYIKKIRGINMNMEVVNALCAIGAFKIISGYALVKIEKKCEEKYMKNLFIDEGYEINRKNLSQY